MHNETERYRDTTGGLNGKISTLLVSRAWENMTRHLTSRLPCWCTKKYNQGRREGGGDRGGQLAPGPKQVGAPNLRNILKLNKAPSKSVLTVPFIGIYSQRFGVLFTGF